MVAHIERSCTAMGPHARGKAASVFQLCCCIVVVASNVQRPAPGVHGAADTGDCRPLSMRKL